jgi:hypothetical protein
MSLDETIEEKEGFQRIISKEAEDHKKTMLPVGMNGGLLCGFQRLLLLLFMFSASGGVIRLLPASGRICERYSSLRKLQEL